ncbi:MAG TPA: hypothetical protein VLG69_03990 [Candidatus Andersenbacteria bacterium]|nr:hypothetical protein [Candidatus Andersenbacteria bacterium]
MTKFREMRLCLQYLFGMYRHLVSVPVPLPAKELQKVLSAGKKAVKGTRAEKKRIDEMLLLALIGELPDDQLSELLGNDPAALATARGKGPREPLSDKRRMQVIEEMFEGFMVACMSKASCNPAVTDESAMAIINFAKEYAEDQGMRPEEITETCSPIIQQALDDAQHQQEQKT